MMLRGAALPAALVTGPWEEVGAQEEEEQSRDVERDRGDRDSPWFGAVSPLTVPLLVSGAGGDGELPGWGL